MRFAADIDEELRRLGHDVITVEELRPGVFGVRVTGDQAAADADLAALLAAGPTESELVRSAATGAGVTPAQAAIVAALTARLEGRQVPAWAMQALQKIDSDVRALLP